MFSTSPALVANVLHVLRGDVAVGWVRACIRWGAAHTGLPVILVAAIALVLSWRLFRQAARLAVELAVALGLLAAATRFGWVTW
jgi:hypothetical protein